MPGLQRLSRFTLIFLGTSSLLVSFLAAQPNAEGEQAPAAAGEEAPSAKPAAATGEAAGGSPEGKQIDIPLPWKKEASLVEAGRRAQSVREMLHLLRIDESRLESFFDERPLHPDEEDSLLRILLHMPRLGLHNLQRWSKGPEITLAEVASQPQKFRTEPFRLAGRVKRVEKRPLLAELVQRYEFDHYYLVTLQVPESPHYVLLCAREVPSQWPVGAELDEPASAYGIFLKVGGPIEGAAELVFATQRVAWHPAAANAAQGISRDWVLLGQHGVDAGQFAAVAAADRAELGYADREAFYQILNAVGNIPQGEFTELVRGASTVMSIFEAQPPPYGKVLVIEGLARRIIRVPIDDADIRERFGLDHYFEVDMFVPLKPGEVISLGKNKEGERPTFRNEFPVMFYARRLPAGIEPSDDCRYAVRATGVFFKTFAYRTEYAAKFGTNQRQLSPLLLGAEPELLVEEERGDPMGMVILVVFSAVSLVIVALAVRAFWRPPQPLQLAERLLPESIGPPGDFSQPADEGPAAR